MAFVLTKVQAYGIEAEEPLNKRYRQYMYLTITAANTDVDLDIGDNVAGSLGTFWAAVDATSTGLNALQAIQDIVTRAEVGERPSLSELGFYQGGAASGVVYTVTLANKCPNILFASGSAPTAYTVCLSWVLKPETDPVAFYQTA
jgi:hypothetical protein